MGINNVDVGALKATIARIEADPAAARKVNRIEGEWSLKGGSQLRATVTFEKGSMVLEADQPTFLGGGGSQPGPMIYCLYGSASCYAATFASMAAMEGIELKRLAITAESYINFSRPLGLSDAPTAEKVKFTLHVDSDAPRESLERLEELSRERCPAVYCLTQPIALETELKTG